MPFRSIESMILQNQRSRDRSEGFVYVDEEKLLIGEDERLWMVRVRRWKLELEERRKWELDGIGLGRVVPSGIVFGRSG